MANGLLLVVDDEAVARLTLQKILQLQGYEVVAVGSGEEAVQELARRPYDLMILDLKMPGMGGMEVLKQCSGLYPKLAVVIITAFGSMDTAIEALRYRATDYLLKPAAPPEILRAVEKALAAPQAAEQNSAEAEKKSSAVKNFTVNKKIQVDLVKRAIYYGGKAVFLTSTEARLIQILWESRNTVLSSSDLVWMVQNYRVDSEEAGKILRPVMSRLRKKLQAIPEGEKWIRNVRGTGYIFDFPEKNEEAEKDGE